MTWFLLSLVLVVAGGVMPLFLFRSFAMMKAYAVTVISAGCLIGLVDACGRLMDASTAMVTVDAFPGFALAFRIDPLAAFFLLAIFAVSGLATVYSFHYMDDADNGLAVAANYFCYSLLLASMAMVVAANNMISFLLAWELMSLSSFFLVIYHHQDAGNRKAGYLYFVFSHVGVLFIMAAFGLVYAHTGSFAFDAASGMPAGMALLAFILAFIGFGSKAGVFPFHVWLPHAHPAAPSHISAVMSGVMIKTGIYGIIRFFMILDSAERMIYGDIVLIAGVVSGVLGVVYALGQHDLKRLLAYHSVENIGIILIGLGIGMIGTASGKPTMATLGYAGGLLHVLNHATFKSLLFMGAGMVLKRARTRTIDVLGGLLKRMKVTGATFIIGSLAISGLPPFNGFVGEFLIYMGGFQGIATDRMAFVLSVFAIVGLAVIGGLALACFTKVVGVVFQGEPRSAGAADAIEKGTAMLIPMVVLAGACLVIGVYPKAFFILAVKAAGPLTGGAAASSLDGVIQLAGHITRAVAVFGAIFLMVLALRLWLYRNKTVTQSGTWGCGFTQPTVKMQYTGSSYAGSILEFFKPVAPVTEEHPPIRGRFPAATHYHSHVNDIAEQHMDTVVVRPVLGLFDKLRWIQHGDIHLYIGYILFAIVALLFFI